MRKKWATRMRPRRPFGWSQQAGSIVVGAETASLIVPSPVAVVSVDPIVDPSATSGGNAGAVPTSTGPCFVSFVMRSLLRKLIGPGNAEDVTRSRFVGIAERPVRRAGKRHDTDQRGITEVCDMKAALGAATPFDAFCQDCLKEEIAGRRAGPGVADSVKIQTSGYRTALRPVRFC